jgi:hypothetical protein
MPFGSLEQFGAGRAALLAGTIESHAGAGYDLRLDGGMAYDLGKGERCGVTAEIAMLDLSDRRRVGGAPFRNRREPDSRARWLFLLHLHHAVMCAVPSSARGRIHVGDSREGQHRRDQRQAEEQKQCDGDRTSHSLILAKLQVDWRQIANALIETLRFWKRALKPTCSD